MVKDIKKMNTLDFLNASRKKFQDGLSMLVLELDCFSLFNIVPLTLDSGMVLTVLEE